MNKICTLVFSILIGSIPALQAQVTLTRSTHGFTPEEKHSTREVEYMEPGTNGQGLIWDFTNLTSKGEVDVASPVVEQSSDLYNVSITRTSDNVRFLYNFTDEANEFKGHTNGDLEIFFDQPLVKTRYPQSYGTSFEGEYGGSVKAYGNVIGNITGKYSTFADATGTILLPGDIRLPALRVKTTEHFQQSCACGPIEVEKYLWYAQNVRYPLFVSVITTSYRPDGTVSSVSKRSSYNTDIQLSLLKSEQNPVNDIAYSVSPNPFEDQIQIQYDLPQEMTVRIDLYNTMGNKLASILQPSVQTGSQTISAYIAPYTQKEGTYFLKLQFGDQVYAEKIIKSKY